MNEGSCDTEDWSNDAENSALHYRNKLHFTIYYNWKVLGFNQLELQKAPLCSFSALFGELKASSNVTEIKTTLQKLKFILKKIK